MDMDLKTQKHLEKLLDYVSHDEKKDFESQGPDRTHIWHHIKKLINWLNQDTAKTRRATK